MFETTNPSLEATRELHLAELGEQSLDLSLDRIVVSIANKLQTDVGSLYVWDQQRGTLVLAATVGLLQSCVGELQMRLDEGLVGLVAEQRAPVVLAHATQHPRFKYFPEADEDEYQSFLGVPVIAHNSVCGVLVVQTIEAREFSPAECAELQKIAGLIAPRLAAHLR